MPSPEPIDFAAPGLLDHLLALDAGDFDALPFGVVGMAPDSAVEIYNAFEAQLSGLTRQSVLGRPFFTAVAPCTNNFMVAHRFESEPELDACVDYVFTVRMRPRKVTLRLLRKSAAPRMFLLVRDR